MKKLVILGNKGMLGKALTSVAVKKGYHVVGFDLPYFDITKIEDVITAVKGNLVVNCSAYTDVEGAEIDEKECYNVNCQGVKLVVDNIGLSGYLVHISTDFVFDGKKEEPYNEFDNTNPRNVYGNSKLQGERMCDIPNCSVLRLQWTYGDSNNNFVSKILNGARNNKLLKVVDDQIGSPTYVVDASNAIMKLLECRAKGIFHYSSNGFASRYEVAKFILEQKNIDCELVPCKSHELNLKARRPLNSVFDNSKIKTLLGVETPEWKESMKKYLAGVE